MALGLDILLTAAAYTAFGAVTATGLLWLVRRRIDGSPARRDSAEDLAPT